MPNVRDPEGEQVKDVEPVDGLHHGAHADDVSAPRSFFSIHNLSVAIVNVVGGSLNGYSIGYVGVYSTLYGFSSNCADYRARGGCETVPNANCVWVPSGASATEGYCGWPDVTCRVAHPNTEAGGSDSAAEASCIADDRCSWSYNDKECQNSFGFSTSNMAIFAGSMILGCMLGALFAGPLVTRLGSKRSLLLVGIVSVICSVLYHVSAAEDVFWVLIPARFVIGIFLGVVCVACPMYVDQNGHPKYKQMIGVLFQIFTTFGIFMAALMGLALGQSVRFEEDKNQMLMARLQGLAVFSTAFSLGLVLLGIFMKESKARFDGGDEEGAVQLDPNEYGYMEMLPRLAIATVMAGTLQLTGINAVMNYAPTIMGNLGLAPLVGNFVVMVWNFVTTLVSVPLASVFSMRQLFLWGSAFTSMMCLFLCGIPVYPGVASSRNVKDGVAITGIMLFIMGFEFAVGPCYFVLTQELFPPSFRPKGASITQTWQFLFNVIINVCYPIATENISGGASGNQDKGQSIAFIFFGCVGLLCFVVQVFFLFPWEEKEGAADAESDAGALEDARNAPE